MDNSLRALCDTIKKVLSQLKPQNNELSFIILTGRSNQGKTSLLKQSPLEEVPVFSEEHATVYFNEKGIIVELGDTWFSSRQTILQNTLKQLNKCNKYIKITGLILCIDINSLLLNELSQFAEERKAHLQLLTRLGSNLGYPVELALIFTKMDSLTGFSEFYQTEHATELSKPLGFSLECINQQKKKIETYQEQFKRLIESQTQQVIHKMHPMRSAMKRSLIRELPLQFISLSSPIQAILQGISPKLFHIHAIYFTSAEQGGRGVDRVKEKIQHEYALVVPDAFPQVTNYRAYFIEGALETIQNHCSQAPQPKGIPQKPIIALAASLAGISLLFLIHHYYKTALLIDEVNKELTTYDTLNRHHKSDVALFHLSNASQKIDGIKTNALSLPAVHQLKMNLHHNAQDVVEGQFLPAIVTELEQAMTSPANTPIARYKALRIYLMLNQHKYFSAAEISAWYAQQWQQLPSKVAHKQSALLQQLLTKPKLPVKINQQLISDTRNFLNALPSNYLYYALAKELLPNTTQKIALEGFNLNAHEIPIYYTKARFKETSKQLTTISNSLQQENWVLARKDLSQLPNILMSAYCSDYVLWWQNFMRKSQPFHYQNYQQAHQLIHLIEQSDALLKMATLIQQETKPDLNDNHSVFNQLIASHFTDINLMSLSTIKEINLRVADLDRFTSTLAVINDGGKTAFGITKTRFLNEHASDPLSLLFEHAQQVPKPLSDWLNQIAEDTWTLLIKNSRAYINQQWKQQVYQEYQNAIARRYPLDSAQKDDINIADFNHFFATHGTLNQFTETYIKPFLDVSSAQWKPKTKNELMIPITADTLDEIIRANVITNMFFPNYSDSSKIEFSLQKISLDPVIADLKLEIGATKLVDSQGSESYLHFNWPQNNAKLALDSIEGNHYELAEQGPWALFKLLEKVNVLVDEQDSASLQILFEINSNSGRYLLKTDNQINPFTPGILNGFTLSEAVV